MCFSAEASFVASMVLIPAGVYCVKTALTQNLQLLPISLIPGVFGLQQFFEGLVWVGMKQNEPGLAKGAGLVFLFFALSFWPLWMPLSAMLSEPRRRVRLFFGVGGKFQ